MEKRMLIAIIIVIVLITGGVLSECYTSALLDEFSQKIDVFLATPDAKYPLADVEEAHKWWQQKHKTLEFFLPHNQLTEIEVCFGEVLGAIKTSDYDSATAMLNRIYATINVLKEMYSFRLGNIL